MSNHTRAEIDKAIAREIGVPTKVVARVTKEFVDVVCALIAKEGDVFIPRLGRFKVFTRWRKDPHALISHGKKVQGRSDYVIRVHFAKSAQLKRALKERNMEKFAVDTSVDQETLEKKAAQGCPVCGAGIIKQGSVLMCPKHGSKPFETPGDPWQQGRSR